jgi:hypothetical protein
VRRLLCGCYSAPVPPRHVATGVDVALDELMTLALVDVVLDELMILAPVGEACVGRDLPGLA